ncbi:hxlR-like helix-turn-helix family protein (plasmid) [Ochrobactrum quorumnocens]|uniref:HxlR-like helix-turn-helix family protein n=2 Tax=Ochrobactrum quorumnocens TaxID=271865 RepID=A0A248UMV2_9HYPH|nr:hxlR-like helix-turn-helix family protein [[Ochrobactrum] quorumnocens]
MAEDHRLRFSALRKAVGEITQRMLTLTLRNLERDGFVIRHYFPEVPPRVEYELTDIGHGALHALEEFNLWVQNNLDVIKARRLAYDQAE